jgi:signal transduction histidine kinase
MQIQAARAVSSANPNKAQEAMAKAQTLAQEALLDVRRSVAALRAPEESLPLPDRLETMLKSCELSGIEAQIQVTGAPAELRPETQLTLYRAVQEGMNNTCKHAQAQHLNVLLDYSTPGQVRLQIKDDGVGSDHIDGGFGLMGLRERVQFLEGDLRVHTSPGQGFELEIMVPV